MIGASAGALVDSISAVVDGLEVTVTLNGLIDDSSKDTVDIPIFPGCAAEDEAVVTVSVNDSVNDLEGDSVDNSVNNAVDIVVDSLVGSSVDNSVWWWWVISGVEVVFGVSFAILSGSSSGISVDIVMVVVGSGSE